MKTIIIDSDEFEKVDHLFFDGNQKVEGVLQVKSASFNSPMYIHCTEEFYEVVTDLMRESKISFNIS